MAALAGDRASLGRLRPAPPGIATGFIVNAKLVPAND